VIERKKTEVVNGSSLCTLANMGDNELKAPAQLSTAEGGTFIYDWWGVTSEKIKFRLRGSYFCY
jgi:hypothetical protein